MTDERLTAVIADNKSCGCRVAKLGNVKPPSGYEIMLNSDGTHYFWVRFDGRESVIHWDRWATYRGAKADSERRADDVTDANFIEGAF